MLYNSANAKLDTAKLPEDFQKLGKGLQYFVACVEEVRALAKALANGDLAAALPSPGNEMAAPLKSLHASLRHLTWQTNQVARGDYKQRVDFMGEFADSFNMMVEQLQENRVALINEMEKSDRKALELEQSNSLFAAITAEISQWIIVIDRNTLQWLFSNHEAENVLICEPFYDEVEKWLAHFVRRFNAEESEAELEEPGRGEAEAGKKEAQSIELELLHEDETQYFNVTIYPLQWQERQALACVLSDISEEKRHMLELEDFAFRDPLTKKFSRHYGMKTLHEMIDAHRSFALCFVDLDNLKYVNDVFLHVEGDAYILRIVRALDEFSPGVIISRLGGDEFMLIAAGWSMERAEARLEELRSALQSEYNTPDAKYSHSFSYGVVESDGSAAVKASELLSVADEKMYAYKRAHKLQRGALAPRENAADLRIKSQG
ncbi:MAG: diguanylate cyclase [Gracilibacteraceae bacterium]|nr:diguanylate cyclase [Gracilibacteraceae bacterium]